MTNEFKELIKSFAHEITAADILRMKLYAEAYMDGYTQGYTDAKIEGERCTAK